jgi:ribose transport system ATP-binding protein/rhamnose transport system ATP-binding protein
MTTSAGPLLEASGISKAFGYTQALANAEFDLAPGEVHALCGANGAGKSTLARVITGQIRPDAGQIIYRGRRVQLASTRDALSQGISIVMQETSLCPELSVLENIHLPVLGTRGRLSRTELRRQAEEILRDLDPAHHVGLNDIVSGLPIGTRQLVEIAKAIALDSSVIILDEPTASFSPQEVERLFDVIRVLVAKGKGLVFVSHRIEEIFEVADRVTVLRDGRTVARSVDIESISSGDLIRHMVGRELTDIYAREATPESEKGCPGGEPVLEVRHLSALPQVRDVSFAVRAGEILGLGGLDGAGRTEAVEAVYGLRAQKSGEVWLNGKRVRFKTPADAIAAGIGFIPEDRRGQGIAPDLSVRENLLLAHLGQYSGWGKGYRGHAESIARLLDELGLPDPRVLESSILNLSGGQQQKIILARWLLMRPKVLILDEPTRGVDIGTRSTIYEILRTIAAQGIAVVCISSEFEEILGLSDRIVIVSDGTTVTDIPASYLDIEKLTMFAAPRTSADATHEVLELVTQQFGGMAYWITCDDDLVYCFDSVESGEGIDTGFRRGRLPLVAETCIDTALQAMSDEFVSDADGRLWSLLTPVNSHRGSNLGFIGLTLPDGVKKPEPTSVRQLIRETMAADSSSSTEVA